ncbi:MAG: hypothetical protein KatS3mg114_0531 [Planctomycetaceae bacterium]|nr:MAG: hypothetical protein KatS3mg114_0531 [Planctomycetaceae bacterium]
MLLIDTGEQNWSWIGAADVTVVVTTPQPVSLAATYALLKQCTYARYTEPIIPRESSRDYDDQDLQLSINSSSAENSDRNSAPSAGDKPPRQTLNPAPWLVINQAESAQQAEHCVTALRRTCRLFLDEDFAGSLLVTLRSRSIRMGSATDRRTQGFATLHAVGGHTTLDPTMGGKRPRIARRRLRALVATYADLA